MWPFTRRRDQARREDDEPTAQSFSISDPMALSLFGAGPSLAGVAVTERTVMGLSAWFRGGALITGTIAGLPMRSLRTLSDGSRESVTGSWISEPAGPDSFTAFDWKEIVFWHLFNAGGTYLQHIYNGNQVLCGLNPIHPHAVRVDWDDSLPPGAGRKRYTVTLDDGSTHSFDARTMTQVMGPVKTVDGLREVSLLSVARTSLGTAIAGDRSAARMFSQGPMIAGLVTPDEELEGDEADKIREDINRRMTGEENAGAVRVINRRLKFTPWSMSLADAQWLDSRQFSIEEIARWTGVPPHLLMQTEKQTSWGTGVEQQNLGLQKFNLVGWTSRLEPHLSRLLPRPQLVEFDYAGLERGSPESEIELLIKQVNSGLLTLNEARRIRNLPRVPGGDVPRGGATPPAALLRPGAHAAGPSGLSRYLKTLPSVEGATNGHGRNAWT